MVLSEAALAQGDAAGALSHARAAAARWPACCAAWNAHARAGASVGGLRHGLKYLAPLRGRHPAALPLMLLTANAHTFTVRLGWRACVSAATNTFTVSLVWRACVSAARAAHCSLTPQGLMVHPMVDELVSCCPG